MRIVLDTNVLLSGLFTPGLCEEVLDACVFSETRTIVLSEHILKEFARNAQRKFAVPVNDVNEAVTFLKRHAELVKPEDLSDVICRDPTDLPVLGTAVAGRADVLITGDKEMLKLKKIRGIHILSPRDIFGRLR